MRLFTRNTRMHNRHFGKENRLRLEVLESRMLLSIDGLQNDVFSANTALTADLGPAISRDDLLVMPQEMQQQRQANSLEGTAGSINPLDVISYSTLPNGLPILNSYPSTASHATIFLDFDGDPYVLNGSACQPYSEDADPATFNAAEQATIVDCWREMSIYYAMFDVNVTTIQPNVSTTPTAWTVLTPNEGNGWSWVGNFPNSSANSFENSYFAQTRESGIAHEVGHTFGNWHTSNYDNLGNKIDEYSSGLYRASPSPLQGPLMGVDFAGVIHKWTYWHESGGANIVQDDMKIIKDKIVANAPAGYTGDGYRPDDFGGIAGSISNATALAISGVTQAVTGIIERLSDVDTFSFTSSGGSYSITAGRDAPSGVDLKLSIYNSSGVLIAAEDGDPRALPYTMVNNQELTLDLSAGTYYAVLECHGNYGDQGQYNLRVDPLPSAWKADDVGLPGIPGYVSYDAASGTYTVAGSGDDIWNSSDSFQFLYQKLSGNGSITARIASISNTDYYAKSGLMIRESLDGGSRFVDLVMTPTAGIWAQDRTTTNGGCGSVASNTVTGAYWLQISRSSNTFTFRVSPNGTSWTVLGTVAVTMGTNVYIGLVSTSHNNVYSNAATFTNVTLTGTLNAGPSLNALPAPGSLAVTAKTASSISLSWADVSGETGYAIERSANNIDFQQIGTTAADATTFSDAGLADAQKYFYCVRAQTAGGAVSVPSIIVSDTTRAGAVTHLNVISLSTTAVVLDWTEASGETSYRVERSTTGTGSWTTIATLGKNVTTVNNTGLSANSQYYYRVVTIDGSGDAATSNVIQASTRLATVSGLAFDNVVFGSTTFHWTALAGATSYRIERSTDAGATYSVLASNVTATTYTDLGLTALQEYYYRVVGVNSLTESSAPSAAIHAITPTATLSAPWETRDIGAVSATGSAGDSGGTFTMIGSGAGITGSNDEFRYVYQPLVGDGSITARVVSLQNTNGSAKAGVMIRQSFDSNSRYAATLLRADGSAVFQSRSGTSTTTTTTTTGISAPYWVRITRSGTTFTSSISADGTTWVDIGTPRNLTSITAGSTVYIGLALTSASDGVLNTSTFSNVSLSDNNPTVATAATANPTVVTGATTALSALGADDHGETNLKYTWTATTLPAGAAQPTYSANGTNTAKNTTATFSKAGDYVFRVTITDANGQSVTSSTATVTVNNTVTSIVVTPASVILPSGGNQQFSAVAKDQFGNVFNGTISWAASSGTIDSSGYFTASSVSPITVSATLASVSGTATVVVDTNAPTVATGAAATPNPITGASTVLSVLGADVEGEANLRYTWTATAFPAGAAPTIGVNGTNAAKNTTANFTKAGDYTFLVTIVDTVGLSTTSSVAVTVNQTVTSITVSPTSINLAPLATYQFVAAAKDQFGNDILSLPAFTWTATAGTIDANGLYTAPASTATATIKATFGTVVSNSATASTVNAAPTVVAAVAVNPNPVTGTTADLSVLGDDDWGEANLTYVWATVISPSGVTPPTFSVNDSNAAKNTTVTFYAGGSYRMRARIVDAAGLSATSFLSFTVNKTLTSIVVTPGSVNLSPGGTQQFTASAFDQFGIALTTAFTWSATDGSITTGGLYTAPASLTTATVQAASGSVVGTATVNSLNNPPSDISLLGTTVAENQTGVVVGTLSTVDPDLGDSFTYLLENDPTGKFEIVGNALKLKDGESLDFEATPTVDLQIRTTDSGNLSYAKTFTISVVDQPEIPTDILLSNATVAENLAGATVGTLSTIDPDLGDSFTYSIQNDPTGKFEIVGNSLKLKDGESLDFEATPSVDLLLRTTDSGNLSYDKTFTISVIVVNNQPTDILLTNDPLAENLAGAILGTLSTVDPDQGDSFTYLLENDPTGKFEIVGNTLKLKDGESLDFEATPSIDLLIRTTDSGSLSYDKTITITVVDQPEMLTIGAGDWAGGGLTLQLGVDSKLHAYRADMTDAVLPHNPANVLGIDVTGSAVGDTLTIISLGADLPTLAVHQATVLLGGDNVLYADTNVTVSGGVLDYGGHETPIGNLTLTDGSQVLATTIQNATTTVTSGTLTATSIISDSLIIGSPTPGGSTASVQPAVAAKPQIIVSAAVAANELPTITSAASPMVVSSASVRPAPAASSVAAPLGLVHASAVASEKIPFAPAVVSPTTSVRSIAVADDSLLVSASEVLAGMISAVAVEPIAPLSITPLSVVELPEEILPASLALKVYPAAPLGNRAASAFAQLSEKLERLSVPLEAVTSSKVSPALAAAQPVRQFALQSLLEEWRDLTADEAESALSAATSSGKSAKLARQAVDEIHAQLVEAILP